MSNRVICGICLNQTGSICGLKKSKVKLNKRRVCDKFRKDVDKVSFKQPITTSRRPDWYWMEKKDRKKLLKDMLASAQKQLEDQKKTSAVQTGDAQHPLTGDLSRFTTTAAKNEKGEK